MKILSKEYIAKTYPVVENFINSTDMLSIKEDRYAITSTDYVNVESYNTFLFEDRQYESHRDYIDLQMIICGQEYIVVKSISELHAVSEYNSEKDIIFYSNDTCGQKILMKAGEFLELMPEDGHMPCISIDGSRRVKKAVFKIKIEHKNDE